MTRRTHTHTGCRRRSVGRTRGAIPTGRDSTEPCTSRTHVLGGRNLPSDDPPYIKNPRHIVYMGVFIVHYGIHDPTRAIASDARTPARGGATGTMGASDLVVRSIRRPTTETPRARGSSASSRASDESTRGRASGASDRTRARGANRSNRSNRAREFDRVESFVDDRTRWRDARR